MGLPPEPFPARIEVDGRRREATPGQPSGEQLWFAAVPGRRGVGRQLSGGLGAPAAALAASARTGVDEITTAEEAEEKVTEALEQLRTLDSIKKVADGIEKGAAKIDRGCESLDAVIRRLLRRALAALAGFEAVARADGQAAPQDGAA